MTVKDERLSQGRQRLTGRFSGAARANERKPPSSRPFSIRLNQSEREALKAAAGTKPVGAFVREQLLDVVARRKSTRRPASDTAMLGQILATLGRSGLASGLSDLGAAARLGTIAITPEMERQLDAVCTDIRDVKRMLFRGLGLAEDQNP